MINKEESNKIANAFWALRGYCNSHPKCVHQNQREKCNCEPMKEYMELTKDEE